MLEITTIGMSWLVFSRTISGLISFWRKKDLSSNGRAILWSFALRGTYGVWNLQDCVKVAVHNLIKWSPGINTNADLKSRGKDFQECWTLFELQKTEEDCKRMFNGNENKITCYYLWLGHHWGYFGYSYYRNWKRRNMEKPMWYYHGCACMYWWEAVTWAHAD